MYVYCRYSNHKRTSNGNPGRVSYLGGMISRATAIAGALFIAAVASAFAAEPSPPLAGTEYTGTTSQKATISFETAATPERITGLTVRLKGKCTTGQRYATNFRQGAARINVFDDGSFSGDAAIKGTGGVIASGSAKVRGRFYDKGRLAEGKISQTVKLTAGGSCRTGEVSFAADAG